MSRGKTKGFFLLIGILLTAAIMAMICYMLFSYLRKPSFDKRNRELLSEENIDATNYQTTLDSTKKRIEDINKKLLKRQKQIQGIE